jgi:tetratricopeptide (TPR) repeat protein
MVALVGAISRHQHADTDPHYAYAIPAPRIAELCPQTLTLAAPAPLSSCQVSGSVTGNYNIIGNNNILIVRNLLPELGQSPHRPPLPDLPQPSTGALIGRDEDFDRLKACLLASDDEAQRQNALLILQGLPGVGKSALANALLRDPEIQRRFWIFRAAIGKLIGQAEDDPTGVYARTLDDWAAAMGMSRWDTTQNLEAKRELLTEALKTERILLYLDNISSAHSITHLRLDEHPDVIILATTRRTDISKDIERLSDPFTRHRAYEVRPLSDAASKALFDACAPAMDANHDGLKEDVLEKLRGLPLAITLIASNLHFVDDANIASRLQSFRDSMAARLEREEAVEDYEAAHVSLAEAIKRSVVRLPAEKQTVLGKLSLFPPTPNTFSPAAVRQTDAAGQTTANDNLDLQDLIRAGMVMVTGEGRYTLHQSISDYGRIKLLTESASIEAKQAIIKFYRDHSAKNWKDYDTLRVEFTNLAQTLDYTLDLDDLASAVQMLCDLRFFFDVVGYWEAWQGWLEAILQRPALIDTPRLAFKVHVLMGFVLYRRGAYLEAKEHLTVVSRSRFNLAVRNAFLGLKVMMYKILHPFSQQDEQYREIIKRWRDEIEANLQLQQWRYYYLGLIQADVDGAHQSALKNFTRSLALCRKISDPVAEVASLQQMGKCYSVLGAYDKAQRALQSAIDLVEQSTASRTTAAQRDIAIAQRFLGFTYFFQEDYITAADHYRKAAEAAVQLQDRLLEAEAKSDWAEALIELARYGDAFARLKEVWGSGTGTGRVRLTRLPIELMMFQIDLLVRLADCEPSLGDEIAALLRAIIDELNARGAGDEAGEVLKQAGIVLPPRRQKGLDSRK